MELYSNNQWTACYGNSYIAEAIAWSENGNHVCIYATGDTAEEADARLMAAFHELKLIPGASSKTSSGQEEGRGDGGETRPGEEESGL